MIINFIKSNWILIIFSSLVAVLFYFFPAPHDRIINIQNYLITVGGIISAFAIAYLSSKIFNLRSERASRQIEIDKYSNKLTHFRRLLYYVMKSRDFWNFFSDIEKFKAKYPGLNYFRLHNHSDEKDELVSKFWGDERDLCSSTIDLYCAMETISGETEPQNGYMLTWHSEKAAHFNYTLDELDKYFAPSNQIWYYLLGRYAKHGQGRFNDTGIWRLYESNVNEAMTGISSKYKGQEFHRETLAEIATEFYEYNLPRLYELTSLNIGVPKSLIAAFRSLIFIIIFGVLSPIILQSITVPQFVNIYTTLLFVLLTSIGLVKFLIDFYKFLIQEIHLNNEQH